MAEDIERLPPSTHPVDVRIPDGIITGDDEDGDDVHRNCKLLANGNSPNMLVRLLTMDGHPIDELTSVRAEEIKGELRLVGDSARLKQVVGTDDTTEVWWVTPHKPLKALPSPC